MCTNAKGRVDRGSTSIADAMLKVNKRHKSFSVQCTIQVLSMFICNRTPSIVPLSLMKLEIITKNKATESYRVYINFVVFSGFVAYILYCELCIVYH